MGAATSPDGLIYLLKSLRSLYQCEKPPLFFPYLVRVLLHSPCPWPRHVWLSKLIQREICNFTANFQAFQMRQHAQSDLCCELGRLCAFLCNLSPVGSAARSVVGIPAPVPSIKSHI